MTTSRDRLLRGLEIRSEYRSDEFDLGSALFEPCLSVADRYDRAAGYFTSAGLAAASRGLEPFTRREGVMRLVTSPLLERDDVDAILAGYEARDDVIKRAMLRGLTDVGFGEADRLSLLSWLVAEGRLEMRVAVPSGYVGIYHEKCAIFSDIEGDSVAIVGSPNETRGGLVDNFEAVDVFVSWKSSESHRVERKIKNFERLWADETEGLQVVTLPLAVKQRLLEIAPPRIQHARPAPPSSAPPPADPEGVAGSSVLEQPAGVELFEYQRTAVEEWWLHDCSGILAMATGTGKTITALAAARDLLLDRGGPLAVVILAPYIHLVDQWCDELRRWGAKPIACYESTTNWNDRASASLGLLRMGVRDLTILVATHATATLPVFRHLIRGIDGSSLMVVADEAHRLGSDALVSALPPNARYRMGLSATPERHDDVSGTGKLFDYFGGVVFEFGIGDAIREGRLTPYEYHPVLVRLEPDELEDYEAVASDIGRELAEPAEAREPGRLTTLLNRRTTVLNTARGKLAALRDDVGRERPSRALIYTANRRQLEAVMALCWERGVNTHQFTGEEGRAQRQQLLRELEDARVPALVAIRCLDEGVDVPSARQGFLLASSGNPREFVQRRGRLLRLAPGKALAWVRDYVVVPDGGGEADQNLIRRELGRVMEFAGTAVNGSSALERLWPMLERWDLKPDLGG
jgi:superfamily II DNA or RNA helicase